MVEVPASDADDGAAWVGEDGAVARLSVDPGVSQTTAALIKELAVWGLRWGKTWLSGLNKQFGEVGV